MAITSIKSKPDGKGGNWSLDRGFNLTATVYVQMTADTGPEAVLRSLGLNVGATYRYPLVGTATETNLRLFLQAVNIDSFDADGKGANVTATFAPLDPSKDEKGPVDENGVRDPFAAPPKLRWTTEYAEYSPSNDKAGQPMLNTAGDPFDPPLAITTPTSLAIVSRVEREYNEDWLVQYKGRINDAEWLGWPAGSVLIRDIAAECEWNADVDGWVWAVEYTFAFRVPVMEGSKPVSQRWTIDVLNAGVREKIAAIDSPSGFISKQIIIDGAPASSPVCLAADGRRLLPDQEPHYLEFDVYPEADFSLLNIPADLLTRSTPAEEPEEPEEP